MEKRTWDKLGIETSLLGFGCMRFPVLADGKIDEIQAEQILDDAIANGVNYIDTAYPYHDGASEPFVGRALKKYNRSDFYLATKLPVWFVQSQEDAGNLLEKQLQRLQTDYIDFYLLHALDKGSWEAMRDLGIVELCREFQKEGKIKHLGFSFHDKYEVFEDIINYTDWDFCQIQYNYMDTKEGPGDKGYQLAEKLGIPLIIMEPVRGGSLAGFSEEINNKFKALDADVSIASYALRWVGGFPNVKVILSGMSTPEQVKDNLETFENFKPLSEQELEVIHEVVSLLSSRIQNACTACRYCMPCPAGVDIPRNFKVWNTYYIYQSYAVADWEWGNNMPESVKAKNCVKCGQCEKECPQKISIRADLERVQQELDNPIWK